MRLIELTYLDGEKFDANADSIEYMRESTNGTCTYICFHSSNITVSETREEIRKLIGPRVVGRQEPSWRAPVYGG